MKIEVTEQDIKDGRYGDCEFCPIALAMSRALGRTVMCGGTGWGYSLPYSVFNDFSNKLPGSALRFMHNFDTHSEVLPFSFEIEVPHA